MSRSHASLWRSCLGLGSLALAAVAGCSVAQSAGTTSPPAAVVLPADARALAYGATAEQVLQNPDLAPKIRGLFGPDWGGASSGSLRLQPGAETYFEQGGPIRMLRIGGTDYIALSSCVPGDCSRRNALLLIEEGGSRLFARLDEGGIVHYYSYGEGVTRETAALVTESGFQALYPHGRPSYAKLGADGENLPGHFCSTRPCRIASS